MKIAIVDDNEDDRKRLQEEITKICDNKSRKDFEITEFFSGEDFINLIVKNENKKYFDIVFLDIYMNGITGIETAKKLRETDNQSKIIFITTSNEFASESYEVKAYDYLIKPFSKERILRTIERIFEDEKNNKKILDLPDGQIIQLFFIIYNFSWLCNNLSVDGNKIQLRCTQKNFEACIQEHKELVQCFKGIVVNITKVDGLEEDRFKLINKEYVPISRRKYAEVKKSYTDYLIERLRQGEDI